MTNRLDDGIDGGGSGATAAIECRLSEYQWNDETAAGEVKERQRRAVVTVYTVYVTVGRIKGSLVLLIFKPSAVVRASSQLVPVWVAAASASELCYTVITTLLSCTEWNERKLCVQCSRESGRRRKRRRKAWPVFPMLMSPIRARDGWCVAFNKMLMRPIDRPTATQHDRSLYSKLLLITLEPKNGVPITPAAH